MIIFAFFPHSIGDHFEWRFHWKYIDIRRFDFRHIFTDSLNIHAYSSTSCWSAKDRMREIIHLQAGQCGNQIGSKVSFNHAWWFLSDIAFPNWFVWFQYSSFHFYNQFFFSLLFVVVFSIFLIVLLLFREFLT